MSEAKQRTKTLIEYRVVDKRNGGIIDRGEMVLDYDHPEKFADIVSRGLSYEDEILLHEGVLVVMIREFGRYEGAA